MYYPKLRPRSRKRYLIDRFCGYDHRPEPGADCFADMENLSGDSFPHLSVRKKRTEMSELDDCPAQHVLAIGGDRDPVILDGSGSLWCGGNVLPHLLPGNTTVTALLPEGFSVVRLNEEAIRAGIPADGTFEFSFNRERMQWQEPFHGFVIPASDLVTEPQADQGDTVTLELFTLLSPSGRRSLCFMGGWVCIFPDGIYANAVRLHQGQHMTEGEDYGPIARENSCDCGRILFEPCGIDGEVRSVVRSDQAPENGYWVDTSEPEPVLKCYSSSQAAWIEVTPFLKCSVPGIAKGITPEDGAELFARLSTQEPGAQAAEDAWDGFHRIYGAYHDPGGANRAEGTDDYVIIAGMLNEPFETQLTDLDQYFLTLRRPLPEMDFVVSCQNRFWGCRCAGDVNELYASKLGDFRNWSVFEGLSTDSWRVSRGHNSPFTGAAVLGGCPLFFREDCLEKVFPSAGGDHSVVTVSLCGIRAGSDRSAVVIRDRLYYHSPQGVCCYNGTLPMVISQALGNEPFREAEAAALGDKYYISLRNQAGFKHLYVYDTSSGFWYKEDMTALGPAWARDRFLYFGGLYGSLTRIGGTADSSGVDWYAETGDLPPVLGTRRYLSRLRITARLDPGAEMRIYLSYDGGPWAYKGSFRGNETRSITFPVWPRRCDRLRLRLEGCGGMELTQLSFLTEAGSDE